MRSWQCFGSNRWKGFHKIWFQYLLSAYFECSISRWSRHKWVFSWSLEAAFAANQNLSDFLSSAVTDNQNNCMKPALVWKGVCKPKSLSFVACEQAPLFGRAKRAARERASVCTFHDIPQMEKLLAGYRFWMLFRLIYRRGGDSWSAAIQSQSKRKIMFF